MSSTLPEDQATRAEVAFVVKALSERKDRSDIIMAVAQHRGCDWKSAERFVSQVEGDFHQEISTSQTPLLLLITVGTLIGGIAVLIVGLLGLSSGMASNSQTLRGTLTMLTLGPLMIIGALIGLWQVVKGRRGA